MPRISVHPERPHRTHNLNHSDNDIATGTGTRYSRRLRGHKIVRTSTSVVRNLDHETKGTILKTKKQTSDTDKDTTASTIITPYFRGHFVVDLETQEDPQTHAFAPIPEKDDNASLTASIISDNGNDSSNDMDIGVVIQSESSEENDNNQESNNDNENKVIHTKREEEVQILTLYDDKHIDLNEDSGHTNESEALLDTNSRLNHNYTNDKIQPTLLDKLTFDQLFFILVLYKADHGHCHVPKSYCVDIPLENINVGVWNPGVPLPRVDLGLWVTNLRRNYNMYNGKKRKGQANDLEEQEQQEEDLEQKQVQQGEENNKNTRYLTYGHVQILQNIDFRWKKCHNDIWDCMYTQACLYKEQHGHIQIPIQSKLHSSYSKYYLGNWITHQRNCYNKKVRNSHVKREVLSETQKYKLEQLGVLQVKKEHKRKVWEKRLEELVEYKKRFGNCWVKQHWKETRGLGKWVAKQRYHYHLNIQGKITSLTDERLNKLEVMEFDWGTTRVDIY